MEKGSRVNMPPRVRYTFWVLFALCAIAAVVLKVSGVSSEPATASPAPISRIGKTVSVTYEKALSKERYKEEVLPLVNRARRRCPKGITDSFSLQTGYQDQETIITLICK
jgi:hypothetical protein